MIENKKVMIPAVQRKDEIEAEKKALQKSKLFINLEDVNVPAVIRQEIKQKIENDPEVRAYVLERKLDAAEQEMDRLKIVIKQLKQELGRC